jgi:hypothetical protein
LSVLSHLSSPRDSPKWCLIAAAAASARYARMSPLHDPTTQQKATSSRSPLLRSSVPLTRSFLMVFYESDRQGHTRPALIACSDGSWRSAPMVGDASRGSSGSGVQSSSASISPLELPIRREVCKHLWVALGEPWFYLRLSSSAGLRLFLVLREGLQLGECLGVTVGRANQQYETASRTLVPDSRAVGEESAPHRGLGSRLSALASSALLDRSALPFSRGVM